METPNLYPLSIGEILDRAFRLYRRHFGLLISITLAAYVPMIALLIASQIQYETIKGYSNIQGTFLNILIYGALTVACSYLYLGQPITLGAAYRAIWKRYVSALGGMFLMGLLIILPALLIILPLYFFIDFFSNSPQPGLSTIMFLLIFLPLASFLGTRWSLTITSIMLEGRKAGEGVTRSWDLTQGYFWHVFSTTFLAGFLVFILGTFPRLMLEYGLGLIFPDSPYSPYVNIILTQLTLIFVTPFSEAITVILYYDLLVRKEGFDLTLQLEQEFPKVDNTPYSGLKPEGGALGQ